MAAKYAVISGTLSATGGGTTDFTQAGFGTVKAAIIHFSQANSTSNPQAGGSASVGFWDGTNTRGIGIRIGDNVSTTSTQRMASETYAALLPGTLNTNTTCAYSVSSITDGIRFTMGVDNTTVERYVTVLLIGGTASAAVGTMTMGGNVGDTASVSGLAFSPDVVWFSSIGHTASEFATGAILSYGVAVNDGGITQRGMLIGSVNNVGDSVSNRRLETDAVAGKLYNDTLSWTAEVTAFAPDGFTVTTRTVASGSDLLYYLAVDLDGDSASLGTLTTPTSTGNNSNTSTAFTPKISMLVGSVTAVDTDEAHLGIMLGATDGTTSEALASHDADNLGTSDANSKRAANVVNMLNPTNGADDVVASFVSFNSDGRTYNYTTVNAAARYGWELLIGSPPTADYDVHTELVQERLCAFYTQEDEITSRSFMKFNIPAGLFDGDTLVSAVLQLYGNGEGTLTDVECHVTQDVSWSEASNYAALAAITLDSGTLQSTQTLTTDGPTSPKYVYFDITAGILAALGNAEVSVALHKAGYHSPNLTETDIQIGSYADTNLWEFTGYEGAGDQYKASIVFTYQAAEVPAENLAFFAGVVT